MIKFYFATTCKREIDLFSLNRKLVNFPLPRLSRIFSYLLKVSSVGAFTSLSKEFQLSITLRATRDRKQWRIMITYLLKVHDTQKKKKNHPQSTEVGYCHFFQVLFHQFLWVSTHLPILERGYFAPAHFITTIH